MKKILVFVVLGIFLISLVSANIFTDAWNFIIGHQPEQEIPSYVKLGLNATTFNTFNTKKLDLDRNKICIKNLKDKSKIVKFKKCKINKKGKYDLIDISNFNYFKINNGGITRFTNG